MNEIKVPKELLESLLNSVNGDSYMGTEWEESTVAKLRKHIAAQAQQENQWMPVETAPTGREFLLAFYYRHTHVVLRRVVTFIDKDVIALGWCEIPPAPEGGVGAQNNSNISMWH